jgi:predicted RNA binding protein YcfA (HicA-like mRNA interferase family)
MASEKRFPEVRKMREAKGYRLDRIRGSHHVFVKPGYQNEIVRSITGR